MRQPLLCALVLFISLPITGGCGGPGSGPAAQPAADTTAPAQPATDSAAPVQAAAESLSGTVLETIDAGPYTYVRVDTGSGEVWAAAPKVALKPGQRVTVPPGMAMENFHSDTLGRDFALVYFVSGIGTADAPAGAPHQMPAGHPPVGAAAGADKVDLSGIEPAAGGVTVATLYASKSDLTGKQVTVRAKVVKSNPGIMGRNWLHIQDGTGDAAAGTNDLTVTTADSAKVGDTVTIRGTLAVDKDFGAGYHYLVIVEGATVTVE